jgi:hypothetical protein
MVPILAILQPGKKTQCCHRTAWCKLIWQSIPIDSSSPNNVVVGLISRVEGWSIDHLPEPHIVQKQRQCDIVQEVPDPILISHCVCHWTFLSFAMFEKSREHGCTDIHSTNWISRTSSCIRCEPLPWSSQQRELDPLCRSAIPYCTKACLASSIDIIITATAGLDQNIPNRLSLNHPDEAGDRCQTNSPCTCPHETTGSRPKGTSCEFCPLPCRTSLVVR